MNKHLLFGLLAVLGVSLVGCAHSPQQLRPQPKLNAPLVATTTTLRRSPSSPRSFSMNSRSSRPRSPTRAMTFTSAEVLQSQNTS